MRSTARRRRRSWRTRSTRLGGEELVDLLVALAALAQLAANVLVGDLDAELVGGALEHELARRSTVRASTHSVRCELAAADAGHLEVGAGVDAARVELAEERVEQLARAHLDDELAPARPSRP